MNAARQGPQGVAFLLAIVTLIVALPRPLAAQATSPLSYRRLFVPEESLPSQIRGLLPLKREEFERRIRLASERADAAVEGVNARIERAVYRARFVENQLQFGTSQLSITAKAAATTLLPLDPCNLALESASWNAGNPGLAIVGADGTGKLHCVVEASGTLELNWRLSPTETSAAETVFAVRLPAATTRRLEIATPLACELTADSGIVSRGPTLHEQPDERLWTIDLGGDHEMHLSVRSPGTEPSNRPGIVVRESASYSLLPASLDVESTFTLDVPEGQFHELKLRIDPGLQVTAARLGDRDMPFRSDVAAESSGQTIVTCQLSQPLRGNHQVVQVTAAADWAIGNGRALPRMQVEGALLQAGKWSVSAPDWLRVTARPIRGCVQTQASSAVSGRASDRFEFQVFAADAAVEVSADEPTLPLSERSGTQITVESNQVLGVLIAELSGSGRGRFEALAEVPRHWIVDSVEAQPPEALVDRSLSTHGSGPQRLQLKLARPITANRPLRLIVRAHYRRPANGELFGHSAFQLASFPAARDGRRLVALRVNDPGVELRLAGDENLVRLEPDRLTPADRTLFESLPEALLFETDAADTAVEATLEPATASYRADVLVRATVSQSGTEQAVLIRCQPEATAVGAVIVRMSPRPRGAVSWRLAGDDMREISAAVETRSSESNQVDEVVYRLLLPRGANSPFEINGSWSVTGSVPVSLVWLPEATRQSAVVEVHSTAGQLEIDAQEVRPLPRPRAVDAGATKLQARYSYETGQRAQLMLRLPPNGRSEPGAWIEMLQVTSYVSPGGRAENIATLSVRNAGASRLRIRLPKLVNECRLVSGADEVVLRPSANGDVEVPLPTTEHRSVLQLQYSSAGTSFGIWPISRLSIPIPHADVPVLASIWRVGLPPELAPLEPSAGSQTELSTTGVNVAHRAQFFDARSSTASWLSNLSRLLAGPQLASQAKLFTRPAGQPAAEAAFRGWEMFSRDLRAGEEPVIVVYRPTVLAAWASGLCLASFVVALQLRLHALLFVPTAGLCLAFALATEPPAAWIAAGVGLGLALGGALRTFRLPHPSATVSPRQDSLVPAGATMAVVAFLGVCFAKCVFAAPPNANADIARVVFPTDENAQAVGEYVYLDPGFYESLHRVEGSKTALPDCLLETARYDFPTLPRQRAGRAVVEELLTVFEFHTFRAEADVHLPLRRDQVSLLERRARLDGLPAALAWQPDGSRLSVTVAAPGKHRLELALAATAQSLPSAMLLEMATPPAAFLSVVLPSRTAGSGEAMGVASSKIMDDGSQILQLANPNHVAVRWPVSEAVLPAVATVQAEQLSWWKIRPASVVLEVQLHMRSVGAPLQQIVLDTDPRLRPLPGLTTGSVGRIQVEEGTTNRTTIEMAEPTNEVRLRLGWLWPEASGAGTLVLPRVNVRADQVQRDWTALSLEPGLEITSLPGTASGIETTEFARAWGESTSSPLAAYGAAAASKSLQVAIRPTMALANAAQVVSWSVSESLARADCSFRLKGVPSTCFEHLFSLPPALKVTRVTLTQSDRPTAIRWTQQADGQLVVSLLESPAIAQTIAIDAELELAGKLAQLRLPRVAMENVVLSSSELRIYRQPEVRLSVESAAGWAAESLVNLGAHRQGLGRLVATFQQASSDSSQPPIVVQQPNRPQIVGKMLIQTGQADGDWRSEVVLDLDITGGALDSIRMIIPEDWAGPFEIEPKMDYRLEPAAGEARRLLVIRPPLATAGPLHVRVRGPLQVGAGGVQAPDVQLLKADNVERLVLLDRGTVGQPIDWETTGLVAANAETLAKHEPAWQNSEASLFRVVAPQFRALAFYRPSVGKVAQVYLADIRTITMPGRRVATTAAYLVNPKDAKDFAFELPAGCRLVQVLVDGSAVACKMSGVRTWKLAAPSDVLPYELTIIYDSFLPADAGSSRQLILAAPHLVGLSAPQALWSVAQREDLQMRVLAGSSRSAWSPNATAANDQAMGLLRLEAYARALEAVQAARGSTIPRPVLVEGFDHWHRLLDAADGRLARLKNDDQSDSGALRRQAALDAAKGVRQRLIQAGVVDEDHSASLESHSQAIDPPLAAQFLVTGETLAIELDLQRVASTAVPQRTWLALCVALVALAIVPLSRIADARNWWLAHAHFVLACAGLIWWLVAPLGWLGWLPIVAGLWLGVRSPWPRLSFPSGSTIQRFPRVDLR